MRILYLIIILKLSSCQRRITNSSSVDHGVNTRFMVSIVSAKYIESIKGWLCAGAIIHPSLILTAASCLHTVSKMYVIAGYRHSVMTEDLDSNICTTHMKKRIVYYCLHSEYGELRVNKGDKHTSEERKYKWTIFDIGIARTDTPIDFFDNYYTKYCSYLPSSISVNFHKKFQLTGADVVVYGWGHAEFYRPRKDKTNYNEGTVRFASTKIMDSIECQKRYKSRYLQAQININYICTDEKGNLDAYGRSLVIERPGHNSTRRIRVVRKISEVVHELNTTNEEKYFSTTKKNVNKNTRRNGICQNDHGGPLIRWIGGHPYVIGVASAFQVTKSMQCVGPYLFTSTHCTSRFINCILTIQTKLSQRRVPSLCDQQDSVRGFKIEETFINWNDENTTADDDYDFY